MKRIEDIKEFKDIDTYYEISEIVEEVFQDRVEAHKHLITANKEIERLNYIVNELEKSKEKQINEYEILILKIERYLNCYQYFLETQEENNKKIANMIHEFSLGSDKE